jgi:hypothetical protein
MYSTLIDLHPKIPHFIDLFSLTDFGWSKTSRFLTGWSQYCFKWEETFLLWPEEIIMLARPYRPGLGFCSNWAPHLTNWANWPVQWLPKFNNNWSSRSFKSKTLLQDQGCLPLYQTGSVLSICYAYVIHVYLTDFTRSLYSLDSMGVIPLTELSIPIHWWQWLWIQPISPICLLLMNSLA